MDYKEKYEALLANIKAYHARFGDTCNLKKELEECVPELLESEDEKKRKRVIECLKLSLKGAEDQNDAGSDRTCDIEALKWGIAYLEKQKERERIIQEREVTDDEETFAYLIGHITEMFYDAYAEYKEKKDGRG